MHGEYVSPGLKAQGDELKAIKDQLLAIMAKPAHAADHPGLAWPRGWFRVLATCSLILQGATFDDVRSPRDVHVRSGSRADIRVDPGHPILAIVLQSGVFRLVELLMLVPIANILTLYVFALVGRRSRSDGGRDG